MIPKLRDFLRYHKKGVIVGVGILLAALILGGYVLWSVSAWTSYSVRYETWQKTVRSSLDDALQSKVSTSRLAALKKTSKELAEGESICHVNSIIAWQATIFRPFQSREALCRQASSRAATLSKRVDELVKHLQSEQQFIDVVVASDTRKAEVTENDFDAQIGIWQSLTDNVKKMPVDTEFASVKSEAINKFDKILGVWKDLVSAHKAKDSAKYVDASARLPVVYRAVSELNELNTKQYKTLLERLQSTYKDAF